LATRKPKEWTPSRKHSFIVAVLRSGTRRWPPKYETLNEAKTEKKTNVLTGRLAQHYKCAKCKKDWPAKQVNVDHIKPAVGKEGFTSWDNFIDGLFCEKENLQCLCRGCHDQKTKEERAARKNEMHQMSNREEPRTDVKGPKPKKRSK